MRASTLYVLKTEGDDIVYAEPILMQGYRLRDIVSLPDGRLAILADGGSLLLVRNAEMHRGEAQRLEVSGLSSLPPPLPDEGLPDEGLQPLKGSAAERGKRYFQGACATCHSLTGETGVGPPLNGVVGRRFAAVAGFGYSDALKARHDTWTEALISSFSSNPAGTVPGTSMPTTGLDPNQADDVVAYLRTTRGR
jgi:cytochrome c